MPECDRLECDCPLVDTKSRRFKLVGRKLDAVTVKTIILLSEKRTTEQPRLHQEKESRGKTTPRTMK